MPEDGTLAVGAFRLHRMIGRGGAGEVWEARHAPTGSSVAVKMLTAQRARDPRYLALFRNEVRVAAAFDHAAIVTVLDQGQVDEEAAAGSRDRLTVGSPYLAMELVEGGSLASSDPRLPWPTVRSILADVLDALAHAHARGVVHRDLKPGNVLVDRRGTAKLSDFGLAQPFDDQAGAPFPAVLAGTPAYMAPEQIEGRHRDFGPWTDLYALGCLTTSLVAGQPPFGNRGDFRALADAHLYQPPPTLSPRVEVPAGLDLWIRRLLMKRPEHRFASAADATRALAAIDRAAEGLTGGPRSPAASGPAEVSTVVSEVADAPASPQRAPVTGAGEAAAGEAAAGHAGAATGPGSSSPFPTDWRPREAAPILGRRYPLGLALHGLHPIPLAGRDPERDSLWQDLGRVCDDGRARLALLRGPAGFGKSRLAEWLCHRADELGVATPLRAFHGAISGPGDGLRQALTRHLRLRDLTAPDALHRVEAALRAQHCHDPSESRALADLLAPPSGAAAVEATTQAEEHAIVLRFLARMSVARPVVLWLDDVHWGAGALEFAAFALDNRDRLPCGVLMVLTAREEALAERSAEAALLADLAARPTARVIEIGPIPPALRPDLVEGGLGLGGELAVRVEERTAGNPLFAVQLVGDWIQRGLIEPTTDGFRLRPGTAIEIPDQLHQVWLARIEEVLLGRPVEEVHALELAAALGQDVDGTEWREACALAELPASEGLVEALLLRRLARRAPDGSGGGWSFVHGMLQESIERRAREAGRGARCHLVCARMLEADFRPAIAERLGRHLLLGGAPERAIEPLILGAFERLEEGDLRAAEALAADIEAAMARTEASADHPARCDVELVRTHIARSRARFAAGEMHAARALAAAERGVWPHRRARALWEQGQMASMRGRWEEGEPRLREAMDLSRSLGQHGLTINCIQSLADSLLVRGDPEAEHWYRAALDEAEAVGHPRRATFARLVLALCAAQTGRPEQALLDLERLRGAEPRPGDGIPGLARLGTIGIVGQAFADIIVGRALLEQQRFVEARAALARSFDAFALHGRRGEASAALVGLAVCAAATGKWHEFPEHIALASRYFDETGFVVRDVAVATNWAGDMAAAAGETACARAAYTLALGMWRALRERDAIAAVESRLGPTAAAS